MRDGYALVALYLGLERLYGLEQRDLESERGARQRLDVNVDQVLIQAVVMHPDTLVYAALVLATAAAAANSAVD